MSFHGLRSGFYRALLCDPPWAFRTYSGHSTTPHRTATDHYPVMSVHDIAALPVGDLAVSDCALFLWVVDSHFPYAFGIANAWGFEYKTRAFEWLKTTNDGLAFRMSLGYWTRKESESCLLFTRGSPRRKSKGVRQVIEAPRREHSRKPDEQYERIEALVDGPYCELFAKYHRPGWDSWGDELL